VHKTFKDIASCTWAEKQIEVLASKGIINGTSDTTYSPGDQITRADYLTLLVKTLGLNTKFDSNFEDINPAAYYYEAIGIARKLGITSGVGNNRFNPNAPITRQDMMVLTERALRIAKKITGKGKASNLDRIQ